MSRLPKTYLGRARRRALAATLLAGLAACGCSRGKAGSAEDRLAEIQRLAAERSAASGKALVEAALNDPAPAVRRAALAGMVQHVEPAHRPALEKATLDADAGVRATAAGVLGLYRDEQAGLRLSEIATGDKDEQVRIAAMRALPECPGPKPIVTLVELAEKAPTPTLRYHAMVGAYQMAGAKLGFDHRPEDEQKWRELAQALRSRKRVQDAYAAMGITVKAAPRTGHN